MEKHIRLFVAVLILCFISLSSANLYSQDTSLVVIGNQVWKTSNAIIFNYRNGDPIPQANNEKEWNDYNAKGIGCWCYYNYKRLDIYENLIYYNWFAVTDKRNIAPVGWHVPRYGEWDTLMLFVGKVSLNIKDSTHLLDTLQKESLENKLATDDLKGKGEEWRHLKGTNESGFNGDGYSWMFSNGKVGGNGAHSAVFWTCSEKNQDKDKKKAYAIFMQRNTFSVYCSKYYGFSLRLIKDPKEKGDFDPITDDLDKEREGEPARKLIGFELKFNAQVDIEKRKFSDNKWTYEDPKVDGRSGMAQKRWDPNSIFIKSSQKDLFVNQTATSFYISYFENEWGTTAGYMRIKGRMSADRRTLEYLIVQFEKDNSAREDEVYKYQIEVENLPYEDRVSNMAGRPGFYQYGNMKSVVRSISFYNKYGETTESCTTVNQDKQENGSFFFDPYFDK